MEPITLIGIVVAGTYIAQRVVKHVVIPAVRAKFKGVLGEREVHKILRRAGKALGKNERFRDIMIPGKNQTAQIDNGLITPYGIFVVETKNYTGEVYGGQDEPMWAHTFANGRKTKPFLNPLMQNKTHCDALRALLKNHPGVPIYNLLAFSDNCEVSPPDLTDVVYFSKLDAAIQLRCVGQPVLTDAQIEDIKRTIDKANMGGKRDREEHITKASLAARAARNGGLDEDFKRTLDEGMKQPVIRFSAPYEEPVKRGPSPEQIKLSDEGAILRINGRTDSIDGFFERAKRDINDMPVPHGAPFDHFICPYTGTSFPYTEAKGFYTGLWTAYLSNHPELVSYMRENGTGALQSSFRTNKLLTTFITDEESFKAAARDTAWYKNLQAHQAEKRQSLNDQINRAEGEKPPYATKGKTCQNYHR